MVMRSGIQSLMIIVTCDLLMEALLDGGYWTYKSQIISKTNIFYCSFVFDNKIIYKKYPRSYFYYYFLAYLKP
jgi:hypothetical protein